MHGEANKTWAKGLQGAREFIRVVDAAKVYQTQDGIYASPNQRIRPPSLLE